MLFSDYSRNRAFAKDPAVIEFNGSYYLYYTLPPFTDSSVFGIGIAKSVDLENWFKIGEVSSDQTCEKNGFCSPAAIVIDNTIHMFYQTYGNGSNDAICHATSNDGVNFRKNKTNPIFAPKKSSWSIGRAIDADVCIHNDRLYLYYATRDNEMKYQKLGVASANLQTDFSKHHWNEECSSSILEPELDWEQDCIEAPAVIKSGDMIYMFYAGAYNCSPQQIGCAISHDAVHFKRIFIEPFIKNGADGDWNSSESGHPYVFEDLDHRIYIFYQGSNDNGETWFITKQEIKFKDGIPVII